jgi:hypothetical protein
VGGYHDDGHRAIHPAQRHQPGQAAYTGHGQIEQHGIDLVPARDECLHALEVSDLDDAAVLPRPDKA